MLKFSWELLGYFLVAVQAIFWLALARAWKLLKKDNLTIVDADLPAVSVIICTHNEMPRLPKIVDILLNQNYPSYEILLVDDRSDDNVEGWIKSLKNSKVRCLRIEETPIGWPPKKWAVQLGVAHAKYDWLVFTDADCSMSYNWIRSLLSVKYNPNIEVILGYSPYQKEPTWVNQLIQTETFLTATLYLGTTRLGFPYMAVGRNMAYKRYFAGAQAQKMFKASLSGDDDLIVNYFAKSNRTVSCVDPDSFVYSEPKKTLLAWLNQKARHYGASFHYSGTSKVALLAFHGSFFLLLIGLFSGLFPFWMLLFRSFAQYLAIETSRKRLKHTQPVYLVWLFEPVVFIFQILLVPYSLIKKPTWK